MAKQLIIALLSLYSVVLSPILKQIVGVARSCRYSPSCSAYTAAMVRRYGVVKGCRMGFGRLMTCHPFARTYGNI